MLWLARVQIPRLAALARDDSTAAVIPSEVEGSALRHRGSRMLPFNSTSRASRMSAPSVCSSSHVGANRDLKLAERSKRLDLDGRERDVRPDVSGIARLRRAVRSRHRGRRCSGRIARARPQGAPGSTMPTPAPPASALPDAGPAREPGMKIGCAPPSPARSFRASGHLCTAVARARRAAVVVGEGSRGVPYGIGGARVGGRCVSGGTGIKNEGLKGIKADETDARATAKELGGAPRETRGGGPPRAVPLPVHPPHPP